jgi:hypothetical protein
VLSEKGTFDKCHANRLTSCTHPEVLVRFPWPTQVHVGILSFFPPCSVYFMCIYIYKCVCIYRQKTELTENSNFRLFCYKGKT